MDLHVIIELCTHLSGLIDCLLIENFTNKLHLLQPTQGISLVRLIFSPESF